ncbi:MAG: hypothetical protein P1V20_19000 [Verrucomicrobiales bacterium]|nr:hypothetical protein [Verrucomicrobiales bacterium]
MTATTQNFKRGEGYLFFSGWLQIATGILSIIFSGLGLFLIPGVTMGAAFDFTETHYLNSFAGKVINYFMIWQIALGWLTGLIMVVSGWLCLRMKGREFVKWASVVNLLNFPHGTTVAIMTLHGLAQRKITSAFR